MDTDSLSCQPSFYRPTDYLTAVRALCPTCPGEADKPELLQAVCNDQLGKVLGNICALQTHEVRHRYPDAVRHPPHPLPCQPSSHGHPTVGPANRPEDDNPSI